MYTRVKAISELAKCDFVIVKEAARQALMAYGKEYVMKNCPVDSSNVLLRRRGSSDGNMLQSLPTTFNDLGPVHTLVPQEVL